MIENLLSFQQRVVEEKAALDEKIDKLNTFVGGTIYFSLPAADQDRLCAQLDLMKRYATVLGERIAAFK